MRTQEFIAQTSGASLLIVEKNSVYTVSLDTKAEWAIGRYDPNRQIIPDIPLASYLVSRSHGWLKNPGDQWYFEDNGDNTNGTFINGRKLPRGENGRNTSVALRNGDILRIDNSDLNYPDVDGVLLLFTTMPIRGQFVPFPLRERNRCTIGREKDNDICENLAYFSARHAEIRREDGRYILSDCNSRAGTFLNGKMISSPTVLREKDIISICDKKYIFVEDQLLHQTEPASAYKNNASVPLSQRQVIVKADIDYKRVKDKSGAGMKELIRNIRLEIREGTLVALLGTAGAGKSTIMNCLNGMDLKGVHGSVVYRGVDLITNFEQMKTMIGSVPQDKTFHEDFTPEQEFRIAAIKRLPGDTTEKEIEERVDNVIRLLGISGVRKSKIKTLSGGEKTRVNIGIELVSDRDMFCMDEPDQGLDPKYKHEVFQILQRLAHEEGKSVISIIHDVSDIDMFDQVIMLVKYENVGRLAFFGTPEEMREKFNVSDLRQVYQLLETTPEKYVI